MLLEISQKLLAIISYFTNFEKGMTVLTGKPVPEVINVMNMMLGARATTDVIRHK